MLTLRALVPSLDRGTVDPDLSIKDVTVNRVVTDSRQVSTGDMFVALIGERDDGHNYIKEAITAGACAILAQRWPIGLEVEAVTKVIVDDTGQALRQMAKGWRQRHRVEVVGITGSVGKTSTKEAIATLLSTKFKVLRSQGNFNTEIGVPLTLLELDESHQKAVLEMGMYVPGDIALLCTLADPDVGVVTNVGPTHMERTGSLQATAKAKRELVMSLTKDDFAVLNGDDPLVLSMSDCTRAETIIYGTQLGHDLWSENLRTNGLAGIEFTMHWQDEKIEVETPLVGRHSVYTAMAASAVAISQGFSLREVALGLRELVDANRIKILKGLMESTILDDTYNASPASCIAALDLLSQLEGEKIAVLGDMLELGEAEEAGHREVGRRVAATADHLITLGARARIIADEARKRGLRHVEAVDTHDEAIKAIRGVMRQRSNILVKGSRGLAMENIVRGLA